MDIKYNGECPMCGVNDVNSTDATELCYDCYLKNKMVNTQLKKIMEQGHTEHCAWAIIMTGEPDFSCPLCNPNIYFS